MAPFKRIKVVFDSRKEKGYKNACLKRFHVQQARGNQAMHRIGVNLYNILSWVQASRGKITLWSDNQGTCQPVTKWLKIYAQER